jgi:hypothetical protein
MHVVNWSYILLILDANSVLKIPLSPVGLNSTFIISCATSINITENSPQTNKTLSTCFMITFRNMLNNLIMYVLAA